MADGSWTASVERAALPAMAEAIGGNIQVLADGGVRSGLDVVRMLALGADFVLLGRAWAYALAGRGEAGVAHVLKLIEAEMRVAMALTGATTIAEIAERCSTAADQATSCSRVIAVEQAGDVGGAHRLAEQKALDRGAAAGPQLISWAVFRRPRRWSRC